MPQNMVHTLSILSYVPVEMMETSLFIIPAVILIVFKNTLVGLGGIYLKNMITQCWRERDPKNCQGGETPFVIANEDKNLIRSNIIEAIIQSPELIRYSILVQNRQGNKPARMVALLNKNCEFNH